MSSRILLVDDEPQMRIALKETLERKGFATQAASNGREAITHMRQDFFQAVVTDVRMPEMGGLALLHQIKQRSPSTPVILLTGHGTIHDAVHALKQGAFDYLVKPFSAESLLEVIERACRLAAAPVDTFRAPIVTQDPAMLQLLNRARQAAQSEATILIEAESGTGKELLARTIHEASPRRKAPFVAINCAAVPDDLLESELFGHERGAFTGAYALKIGKFQAASPGTLLLDEIGEMSTRLQAKLLRVLQEREITRLGSVQNLPIDVRVIATTNRNLRGAVDDGTFREDLFYRLNVIPLRLPPLRSRRGDIPHLIACFCQKYLAESSAKSFSEEALEMLARYSWPGNVRELENVTRRALALCPNPVITPSDLFLEPAEEPSPFQIKVGTSIKELEKEMIRITLEEFNGNRTHTAEALGISLRTLRNKLSSFKKEGDYF